MSKLESLGPIQEPEEHKLPVSFLIDSGLLFEINRQILHPFGLALAVYLDEEVESPVGYLIDSRDDQEGFLFADPTLREGDAKYQKFMSEFGTKKLEERLTNLGFVIQSSIEQESP